MSEAGCSHQGPPKQHASERGGSRSRGPRRRRAGRTQWCCRCWDVAGAGGCEREPASSDFFRGYGVDMPAPRQTAYVTRCAEHHRRRSRAERSSVDGGRGTTGGRWGRDGGPGATSAHPTSSQAKDERMCRVPLERTRVVHAGSAEGDRRRFARALGDPARTLSKPGRHPDTAREPTRRNARRPAPARGDQ